MGYRCITIFGVNFFRLNFRLIRVDNTFFHFVLLEFDSCKSFQSKYTEYRLFISGASHRIGIRRRELPRIRNENSTDFVFLKSEKKRNYCFFRILFFLYGNPSEVYCLSFPTLYRSLKKTSALNRFSCERISFRRGRLEKKLEKLKMF